MPLAHRKWSWPMTRADRVALRDVGPWWRKRFSGAGLAPTGCGRTACSRPTRRPYAQHAYHMPQGRDWHHGPAARRPLHPLWAALFRQNRAGMGERRPDALPALQPGVVKHQGGGGQEVCAEMRDARISDSRASRLDPKTGPTKAALLAITWSAAVCYPGSMKRLRVVAYLDPAAYD